MKHKNGLDLLPEQVDRDRGGPVWVLPLAWSLAMFILLVLELYAGKQPWNLQVSGSAQIDGSVRGND